MFIGGAPVSGMSRNAKARLRSRSIGYVFQDFNLLGQAAQAAPAGPNLPANQLIVYLSPGGLGELIPRQSAAGLRGLTGRVEALAASLHAQDVLALESAVKPAASAGPGGRGNRPGGQEPAGLLKTIPSCPSPGAEYSGQVYVATPALLRHYGIKPGEINPTADLLTSRTGLAAVQLASGAVQGCGYNSDVQYARHPPVQAVSLPTDTSDPNTLLTTHALTTLRWRAIPAGWLIQTARPLTAAQLGAARQLASAAGVTVETRAAQDLLSRLRDWATGAGLLLALGVLAMTVGLIRSETASDLRTLTATGAGSRTRCTLTATTAGALGLLGALLGTAGAYLALIAWHRSNLDTLRPVPVTSLLVILIGLPLAATAAAWLLAGREPAAIARRPIE